MSARLLLAGLVWTVAAASGMVITRDAGWRQGYAAAEREAVDLKAKHDAEMAKMGLCEWPKAFARETGCPGY